MPPSRPVGSWLGIKLFADQAFAQVINEKLAGSHQQDIFVYVHGYKTVFERPLEVATELWHYLGYDGVFIAYAWPATPNRLAYFKDAETAELSGNNLRLALEFLTRRTNARRIHIIGYSAGTRVVFTALQQLALIHRGKDRAAIDETARIGRVTIIASDYDSTKFGAAVAYGMLNVPTALSIYMSESDSALDLSRLLLRQDRLGQIVRSYRATAAVKQFFAGMPSVHFIDVTRAERSNTGNGHTYFRRSPWASSDILMSLKYGLDPVERGLERPTGAIAWTFPPNYIARLRAGVLAKRSMARPSRPSTRAK